MLNIERFLKENKNWRELLCAEPYCLRISEDENYVLFKYNQIDSDFSIDIVKEARGIIFDKETLEPVCIPFFKFFNYGETNAAVLDWSNVSVQEKIDGSLIKLWFDKRRAVWKVSTNGTIDAFEAPLAENLKYKTFGDLFAASIPVSIDELVNGLDTSFTYMFELVSPYNRVVIPYEENQVYFLGARDNNTLQEFLPEDTSLAARNWFKIPKRFSISSLDSVISAANALPWEKEGYVCCDKHFNRIKIKSPKYIMAHYARNNNNITLEKLVEVVLSGEKEEFLTYAADYAEELNKVEETMKLLARQAMAALADIRGYAEISRKDYAFKVQQKSDYMRDFLFRCYDEKLFFDYAKNWSAAKWATYIEPYVLKEGRE